MDFRRALDTVLRWYWLILLAGILTAISGYVTLQRQPEFYSSTATIMVGRSIRDPNPNSNDLFLSQQLADTYKEIAERRPARDATMAALGLQWLPSYSVISLPNTQLLEIRVVDVDPQRAYEVANELARQLIALSPAAQGTMNSSRKGFLERQVQGLESGISDTEAQIDELRTKLTDLYSAHEIASTRGQITALEGKLRDLQSTYAGLIVLVDGGTNSLQIVEPAELPTEPISSDTPRSILILTTLGLLLGLGAAFLLDQLGATIRTPEDAAHDLQLPVFSTIMRMEGQEPSAMLISEQRALTPDAESYRLLLTGLEHNGAPQVIMVTSAGPVEGKSLTAANLGLVMAQEGRRVVLVDADLRHPTVHALFGRPNYDGLSILLRNRDRPVALLLQDSGFAGLRLLTSGQAHDTNPAVLLRSEALQVVLGELRQEADTILIDTSPVLAVTDAVALASKVDGVLFVVDASKTRRKYAIEALRALQAVNAKVCGVVLNRVNRRATLYHRYDYYYSHPMQTADQAAPQGPQNRRRWFPDVGLGR